MDREELLPQERQTALRVYPLNEDPAIPEKSQNVDAT
jgi:hypothetical protein